VAARAAKEQPIAGSLPAVISAESLAQLRWSSYWPVPQ